MARVEDPVDMIDMVAIVNLSRLFTDSVPSAGTKLRLDRYVSSESGLGPLGRGGRLYLVTFSPPPEALWLVAILDQPTFDGAQWIAAPSEIPVTDISQLRPTLRFVSGRGIPGTWCDACQQTHWYGFQLEALTSEETALLDKAAGFTPAARSITAVAGSGTGKHAGPLLDAVLEDPASDEARRVYADQLLAENDLRGEYIHVELALTGPLAIRKREQLAARGAHLFAAYSAIWWPYNASHLQTQKGFLRAIHGTWQQIDTIAPALFASEPVTEVGILDVQDEQRLTALLASPWLRRLHRLIVRKLFDDTAFATLAASPLLADLRALNVARNELGPNAFANMANAFPRVRNLVLTGNPIDDAGLEHLRAWSPLTSLDTLYLSDCDLSDRGIEALLADAPFQTLATLTLSNNQVGDDGAGLIASRAMKLPALEHLELRRSAISESGALALAAALPKLRRLDVRDNKIDPVLARADARLRV